MPSSKILSAQVILLSSLHGVLPLLRLSTAPEKDRKKLHAHLWRETRGTMKMADWETCGFGERFGQIPWTVASLLVVLGIE